MNVGLTRWEIIHAMVMLPSVAWGIGATDVTPVIAVGCFSLASFAVVSYPTVRHIKPAGGLANIVTLGRLILFVLALVLMPSLGAVAFSGCMIVVLIADGIDGYLARRRNEETTFGALFDMETDAFIGCTLALTTFLEYRLFIAVIAAGVLRYVFVIGAHLLGLGDRKVYVMEAKIIAIIYFVTLLTPLLFGGTPGMWITLFGSMLIFYSFAREGYLLIRAAKGK